MTGVATSGTDSFSGRPVSQDGSVNAMHRPTHKPLAATVATAALIVLSAVPAWAHVTITPPTVAAGAPERVIVRVPNEIDGRRTVRVELDFPPAGLLRGTVVEAVPGWSATERLTPSGEVSQVVWTAAPGGGVGTGQTAEFPLVVIAPPVPELLIFKALQTYDDGTVVRWIEPPNPDGSAAPRPYPTLLVTGPGGAPPTTTIAPPPATGAGANDRRNPEVAVAIAVALGGIAAAWWALHRSPRLRSDDPDVR
jgi:uncharacterized protein YcnI